MKKKLNILITAGPTREKIDAVRFISNRSTGKMGYAIANAALSANLDVTLISGPVNIPAIKNIKTIYIESASEMASEVFDQAPQADIIIMSAAVADYKPILNVDSKIKKQDGTWFLELERTVDILSTLGQEKKSHQYLVGFAAETENLLQYAEQKLEKKNLDLIIANDISKNDQGFASEYNAVTIIDKDKNITQIPKQEKQKIADIIITHILKNINVNI